MRNPKILLCTLAGLACAASAGEITTETAVLDITGNANLTAELVTFVGNDETQIMDAAVVGTLSLSSSDFSVMPGDLQFADLDLMFVPAAEAMLSVNGGKFLGDAEGALTLTGIAFDGAMLVPSSESGLAAFTFPISVSGNTDASYSLIGIEPQTNSIFDLSGASTMGATLEIIGMQASAGTLTVEAVLLIDTVSVPYEAGLVEMRVSGSMDLAATGEDPTANTDICSRADIAEPCGMLDLSDITLFISSFVAMDPVGDFTGEGTFDLNDIVAFVTAFTSDVCDPAGTYYCYGYAAIDFDKGNSAYAMGDHTMLTAGIAVSGCALMLGFGSFRRKQA